MLGTGWLGTSSAERALRVSVDISWLWASRLPWQRGGPAASWAALTGARPGEAIIPLYLALIRPHLEYSSTHMPMMRLSRRSQTLRRGTWQEEEKRETNWNTRGADMDIQRNVFLHNNNQEVEQVAQKGPDPALCRRADNRPLEVLSNLSYLAIKSDSLFHSNVCLCRQTTSTKPPHRTGQAFQNIND